MVMRASLGATRRRLVGQLLTESLLVAVLGGATGVALAWLGLRGLLASGAAIPRLGEIALDGSILLWTGVITLGSALLFGLAPMARVAAARLGVRGLGERGSSSRSVGWNRLRSALVTAEFAIALSLATGAGLLLISFVRLQRVDPGYDAIDVLAVQLSLPTTRYPGPEEIRVFWEEASRRTAEIPGVMAVGVADGLPPGGAGSAGTNNFDLLDRPVTDGESEPVALWNMVSPDFLSALGVPLLKGRVFDERDRAGQEPVILVSDSWVRRFYPDGEVLGAQLFAGGDRSAAMTVVGVVGDVKYQGLDVLDDAAVYEPDWQAVLRMGYLVVRGRSGVELVEPLRAALSSLDPNLPTTRMQTMVERTRGTLAQPRQWTTLLGLFAGFGLLLACVGVYGVLSHFVSTQKKEIGIRVSLGAEPSSVRRLVIARGMSLATVGIALGVGASLYLARWLRALVFGVSPHDPWTLAMVALGLAMVALVSCTLPALSATRIDPAITLKGD
jgi:predicted permease